MYRTHKCTEITKADKGKTVTLAGWIDVVRDHGGITFVDLRDSSGIMQIVLDATVASKLPPKESVISVSGTVSLRSADSINPKLKTGEIEIKAKDFEILSTSLSILPFDIGDSLNTREEVRLKHRFLDLRNPLVANNIHVRSKVIAFLREQMRAKGFLEVQTPILTASSPEGARDYLVPSRKHKGKFYALPQAPQQFKQLLMVSGFDRYFQIAPCFRDEDARADRTPGEFYQLDFEMSFATQEDVFAVLEDVLYKTFTTFSNKKVSKPPFKRITFDESMAKYGNDKPDLRNPLIIEDLTDYFKETEFAGFKGKPVRGILACSDKINRSFLDRMTEYALSIGMKGLGYITLDEFGALKGPIAKFLSKKATEEFLQKLHDAKKKPNMNPVLLFISDTPKIVNKYAGYIRTEMGKRLDLIDKNKFEFCLIVDFPMYEENEETNRIDFTHNPFSMPQGGMEALRFKDPLEIKAFQYDVVCNGIELTSGAVRNHRPDIMEKVFEIAGYSKKELEHKFSALYNAFHYGAPPHAGAAPGIDRMVMMLLDQENVREIIAFPLNSNSQDQMLNAPSDVTEQQLREIHIKVRA